MNITPYALPVAAVAAAGLVALSPLRSYAAEIAVAGTGAFVFSPMWLFIEQSPGNIQNRKTMLAMKILLGFTGIMKYSSLVDGLLTRTANISPERIRWVLCGIGTGSAGIIFALRNLINYGACTRWDRKTVISQALFSCAVGILYTGLFGFWLHEKVNSQTQQLAKKTSENPPEISSLLANPAELCTLDVTSFVGDQAIVNLQRAIEFSTGHYVISSEIEKAPYSFPFQRDNWQKICQYLGPHELIQLARTCRYLYKTICGPSGAPIWLHQGMGSVKFYQKIYVLPRAIENEMVKRNTDGAFLIKAEIFRQALYLAYPDQLASPFNEERLLPSLVSYRNLCSKRELFEADLLQISDRLARAAFYQNMLPHIIHFGLPVNAAEYFRTKVQALIGENGRPFLDFSLQKAIKRINTDHPQFESSSFIPDKLFTELVALVLDTNLSIKPDMYHYQDQIRRYLPEQLDNRLNLNII